MYKDESVTASVYLDEKYISRNAAQKYDFVFLIDSSGSMQTGSQIIDAKATLQTFLNSLPFESQFNIHRFSTGFDSFKDTSVSYSKPNVIEARKWID